MGRLSTHLQQAATGPGARECTVGYTIRHLEQSDPETADELEQLLAIPTVNAQTIVHVLAQLDDITWRIGHNAIGRHRRAECACRKDTH